MQSYPPGSSRRSLDQDLFSDIGATFAATNYRSQSDHQSIDGSVFDDVPDTEANAAHSADEMQEAEDTDGGDVFDDLADLFLADRARDQPAKIQEVSEHTATLFDDVPMKSVSTSKREGKRPAKKCA